MNYAEKLKLLRIENNLSQSQMADKINISQSAYYQIEKGNTDLTVSRLFDIAKALNISIMELLGYNHEPNDNKRIEELEKRVKELEKWLEDKTKIIESIEYEISKIYQVIANEIIEHFYKANRILEINPLYSFTNEYPFCKFNEDTETVKNIKNYLRFKSISDGLLDRVTTGELFDLNDFLEYFKNENIIIENIEHISDIAKYRVEKVWEKWMDENVDVMKKTQ